jgi:hypothetical protein
MLLAAFLTLAIPRALASETFCHSLVISSLHSLNKYLRLVYKARTIGNMKLAVITELPVHYPVVQDGG